MPSRPAADACLKAAFSAIGGAHFFESAFGGLTTEQATSLCAAGREGKFLADFFQTIGGEETPVFADVVKALAHHIDQLSEDVAVVTKIATSLDVKHPGTGLVGIRTTKRCNKGWGMTGQATKEKAVVTGVAIRAILALVLAPTDKLFWEQAKGDRLSWEPMSWEEFALQELGPVILSVCALTLSADFDGVRPAGLSPKVSWLAMVPWIYVGGNVGLLKTLPRVGGEFKIPAEHRDGGSSLGLNAKIWHVFPKIYASNSKKECQVCKPVCVYKNNPVCCLELSKSAATVQEAATTPNVASPAVDVNSILLATISTLNDEIARLKTENEHLRQMAACGGQDDDSDSNDDDGN